MLNLEAFNLSFPFFLFIYLFLFFYALERSIFAFSIPTKTIINKDAWLTIIPSFSFAIFFFLSVFEFSLSSNYSTTLGIFGFCIFLFGVYLRYITLLSLRSNDQIWLSHIEADYVKKIIKNGPYQYIAHPYYLSVMLELLGICLFLNSIYSFFIVLLLQSILLLMRIKIEELNLITKFGKEYVDYKSDLFKISVGRKKCS